MRMRQGDQVNCFDGAGLQFRASIHTAHPKQAVLTIEQIYQRVPPPLPELHLGLSLIKGQGQDRALAAATEVGATHIWLFTSDRSNLRLDAKRQDKKIEHWEKVVLAAAEQCGRAHLPHLAQTSLAKLLEQPPAKPVVLHQAGAGFPHQLEANNYLLLIGPEGGWSSEEETLFEHQGIPRWCLAEHTLRAETVPGVAAILLQQAMRSPNK